MHSWVSWLKKMLVWLEIRTLAHARLIGFPNAGKSTLLRTLTKARTAVAAYEFAALIPHLEFCTSKTLFK